MKPSSDVSAGANEKLQIKKPYRKDRAFSAA
jgi:hypothetical protein